MTETTQAAPELSVADFKAMFSGKEVAPVAPAATATPEAPKTTEPEAIATPEAETTTETTEPERDDHGRFKAKEAAEEPIAEPDADDLPKNVQKRIGKAVAKQREAEREAEALRAEIQELKANRDRNPQPEIPALVPSDKPKLDQFDSVEEWEEAVAEWREVKRTQKQQENEAKQTIEGKKREARKQYPDFDNVAFSPEVIALINRNKPVGNAVTESPIFAKLAMHLGQNTEELARIVELTPYRAIAEIGKLEDKLSASKTATNTPKPPAQPLPKPPTQLASTSTIEAKPQADWTAAEWRAHFESKRR
jgi:hypothetical protein